MPAPPVPLQLRVLVVEDHEDCLQTMIELLRALAECEVRGARNAPEAIRLAGDWRPHVILLDLGLPLMDGYEAAQRVRALGGDPRPLIVAVTGWGSPAAQERAAQCGIDAFMVKPVAWEQLAGVLRLRGAA